MTDICKILKTAKNIAVVGISRDGFKTSNRIAGFLVDNKFNVAGVNPAADYVGGIKVYSNLRDIPFKIDIVNVFRRSEDIPGLIDDILAVKPAVCWLQLGIRNDEAVKPLIEAGIEVIQDKCIKIEYNECF